MIPEKKYMILFGVASVLCIGIAIGVFKKQGRTQEKSGSEQAPEQNSTQKSALTQRAQTNGVLANSAALTQRAQTNGVLAKGRSAPVIEGVNTNQTVSAADQKIMTEMHDLLDVDNQSGALQAARKLMASENASVRSDVVEVLGWIGVKALPELSQLIVDGDPDVARDAIEQWKRAVKGVADEAVKADVLIAGMLVIKKQDELESCAMEFSDLPNDLTVRSMVKLIQSGNPIASEVARAHYEFVTSEAYVSPQLAEKWIKQNPEQ